MDDVVMWLGLPLVIAVGTFVTFTALMTGGMFWFIILFASLAVFIYFEYHNLINRRIYRGAVRRQFEMRGYDQLPKDERPDALMQDLMAEPWGLRMLKGSGRFKDWSFQREFETKDGDRFEVVVGLLEKDRFRPTFVIPPSAAWLKDKVERFAREKGWDG